MKLCWDNIENLKYIGKGKWRKNNKTFIYKEVCKNCNEPFLMNPNGDKGIFCCRSCNAKYNNKKERNPMYGRHHTEETRRKISKNIKNKLYGDDNPSKRLEVREKIRLSKIGIKLSEETKKKISKNRKGKAIGNKNHYQGGYNLRKIPKYDLYADKISYVEEVRRNNEDPNILEVKCTYCGRWHIQSLDRIRDRIQALNGNYNGERRFYCSNGCKKACPIYGKSPEQLMKEDAIRAGRLNWIVLNREVQPELRQLVMKRDNYICTKCNNTGELHCHHILPVATDPLLSADVDNCLTLCKRCHKDIHKLPGCGYNELKIEIC